MPEDKKKKKKKAKTTEDIIFLDHVSKEYDDGTGAPALNDVSVRIRPG